MKRKLISILLLLNMLVISITPAIADDGINYLSPSTGMVRHPVSETIFNTAFVGTYQLTTGAPATYSLNSTHVTLKGQAEMRFRFNSTAIRIITSTVYTSASDYTIYLDDVAVLSDIATVTNRIASSMYYVSGLSSGIHSMRIKNNKILDATPVVYIEAVDLNTGGILYDYSYVTALPSIPTGLAVNNKLLSWSANPAADNVTTYHIYDNNTQIASTGTTSYSLSGLSNGVHTISVTASNSLGEGAKSTSVTYNNLLPAIPTGVSVTGSGGSGTLSWSANASGDNVTSYKVYDNGTLLTSTATTSYPFTGFGVGSHSLTVSAVNVNGESAKSTGVSYIVLAPPSKISGLVATGSGGSNGVLTWASSPTSENVTNYSVYDTSVLMATPTVNTYAFSGLGLGIHTFQVSATNIMGEGIKSDILNYTVIPPPTAVTLTVSEIASGSAKLTWNSLGTGVSYSIYKSINGTDYTLDSTVNEPSVSHVVSGLTSKTDYWYKVIGTNVAGSGDSSNIITFQTLEVVLPSVPALSVSNITVSSATLSWESYPDSTYCIYEQNGNKIKELSEISYNLTGLGSDMELQYFITVVNSAGESQKGSVTFRTLPKEPFSFVGKLIDIGMTGQGILSGLVLFFKSTWYLVVLLIVVPVSIWLAKTLVRLGVVDKDE